MTQQKRIGFDDYMKLVKYSDNTTYNYLTLYNRFLEIGHGELSQHSVDHFLSLHNTQMARAMLKTLFKWQAHIGIDIPPMNMPKLQKRNPKDLYDISYTLDDVHALIQAAPTLQTELMIRIAFEGALRASEIADIRRQDINLEENEIRGVGKRSERFTVRFSDETKQVLEDYLDHMADDEEHLFIKVSNGKKASRKNLDYYFKRIARKVFPDRSGHLHMFRHSRLRLLREQGLDIMDIKDYARHKDVTSTQRYTQVDKRTVRAKVAQQLEKETLSS